MHPQMRILLPVVIVSILSFVYIVVKTYHLNFHIIYISIGIVPLSFVVGFMFYLIRWNYYSKYPSQVEITIGNITLEYQRMFSPKQIYSFSSGDNPTLFIDSYPTYSWRYIYYLGKINIHTNTKWPIALYVKLYRSKQESLQELMQIAEMFATRSGFRLNKYK
jgi:hypothetical protein